MKKPSKKIKALICAILALTVLSSSVAITYAATTCSHVYAVSKTSLTNCTTKGSITLQCQKCGTKSLKSVTLGHKPKISKIGYRKVYYTCERGCSDFSAEMNTADLTAYKSFVNLKTDYLCAGNMAYYDVVNDGIINAKDFAYLEKINKIAQLSNVNSTEKTKQVYKYLCDINGKKTLSAQQESTWMGSADYEMNYIYNNTGKYPAMRGLDYMNDDFKGVNKRAKAWWDKGGLVTICWHCGPNFNGEWNNAMNETVSNWANMLTEGTTEYNNMIAGMDKAAKSLKELQDQGVVVLWRPFHEFDGNWFWWSKGGATRFIKMWQIMYDRYTNYWGLNNLIWVLGYSHQTASVSNHDPNLWYPGDEYCDIVGADTYDATQFSTLYTKMKALTPKGKPVVLHECGKNPTPTQLGTSKFAYFMTWHTNYITDENTATALKTLYNSDRVITLDEVNY